MRIVLQQSLLCSCAVLWSVFAWAYAEPPQAHERHKALAAIEEAAGRLEQGLPSTLEGMSPFPLEALEILRRPRMTPFQYRESATRQTEAERFQLPLIRAEMSFHLARHAYALGIKTAAGEWIEQIPDTEQTQEWFLRGRYLQGVLLLEEERKAEAEAAFTGIVQRIPDDRVSSLAKLALARMAFDSSDFATARDLYQSLPTTMPGHARVLEEAAWAQLRLGDPDSAALDLDSLFLLYPDDPGLSESGLLFGLFSKNTEDPDAAVKKLELLSARFSFEAEAAGRAVREFDGFEEEVLLEFLPDFGPAQVRGILPSVMRARIRNDPRIRTMLAETEELKAAEESLERNLAHIEAMQRALHGPGAATIEGVVLWEWANSIQAGFLKATRVPDQEAEYARLMSETLSELRRQTREEIERLRAIDEHISINWRLMGGERDFEALDLRRSARAGLESARAREIRIERVSRHLEAERLRQRRASLEKEAEALTFLSSSRPELVWAWERIDRVRETVRRAEEARTKDLSKALAAKKVELVAQRNRMREFRLGFLRKCRPLARRALSHANEQLTSVLGQYRWNIAEVRSGMFRAAEDKRNRFRAGRELEMAELDSLYTPIEVLPDPKTPSPPRLETAVSHDVIRRRQDVAAFSRAARVYIREIHSALRGRIERTRRGFENHFQSVEVRSTQDLDQKRGEAISAFNSYLYFEPQGERAAEALYNLARLHYDQAVAIPSYDVPSPETAPGVRQFHLARAEESLDRLLRERGAFPRIDAALYLLGAIRSESGEEDSASAAFKRLVSEHPGSPLVPEVELRIGEHYFGRRRYAEALPHYRAVLSRGFGEFYDKALYKQAWANYLLGRYDAAITDFLSLLDLSGKLSDAQRVAYTGFEEEASEYIAFSLYRSGGADTAFRVFNRIGWVPAGRSILMRMSEIAADRGDRQAALKGYELAAKRFPTAPELPEVFEHRIRLLEELRAGVELRREKESAIAALDGDTLWRRENRTKTDAYRRADLLVQRATFSLATQIEAEADRTARHRDRQRAATLYTTVAERFPESPQAYDARYRLAEIALSEGRHRDAARRYDEVVRTASFGHHFADALYGIVVAREKALEARGGLDAAIVKSLDGRPEEALELARAACNFAQRAPFDPRSPQALFRAAFVQARMKMHDDAEATYLRLSAAYPGTQWADKALLAAVDSQVSDGRFRPAADLVDRILRDPPPVSDTLRAQLLDRREGALFKAAEEYARLGDTEQALSAYTEFQKDFPDSQLASAALFNAFIVARRDAEFERAQEISGLLVERYPGSLETAAARLDRALLLDMILDIPAATAAYEAVLAGDGRKEDVEKAAWNLSRLVLADPQASARQDRLLDLARRVSEPLRAGIEMSAADYSSDRGDTERARLIWADLYSRKDSPLIAKLRAASALARESANAGEAAETARLVGEGRRLFRRLPENKRDAARDDMAAAMAALIRLDRIETTGLVIDGSTERSLTVSFGKKASRLASLENTVMDLISFQSATAAASGLYELGLAYTDFVEKLRAVGVPESVPSEEREAFAKSVDTLAGPLKDKAGTALSRSREILTEGRINEPYLASIIEAGGGVLPSPDGVPPWAEPALPDPPEFLVPPEGPGSDAGTKGKLAAVLDKAWTEMSGAKRRAAIAGLDAILLEAPDFTAAAYNLGILHAFDGDADGALRAIDFLQGKVGDSAMGELRAVAAQLRGDWHLVAQINQEILSLDPKNEGANWRLVTAHIHLDRGGEALRQARGFLRRTPTSSLSHRALGAAARANGQGDLARLALERARGLDPSGGRVLGEFALALDRQGEKVARSQLLREAAQRGHPESIANWATAAFLAGDLSTAEAEWRRASDAAAGLHRTVEENLKRFASHDKGDD